MEVVAALSVVALLASNIFWLRAFSQLDKITAAERRELLTRITHPEMIPVAEPLPPDAELLTAEPHDDYGLVGTVEGGADNG